MADVPNPNKLEEVGKPIPHGNDEPGEGPARINPAWESGDSYYSRRPASDEPKPGDFTPMTWVMIVIAGIALGFAIAMTFAGA